MDFLDKLFSGAWSGYVGLIIIGRFTLETQVIPHKIKIAKVLACLRNERHSRQVSQLFCSCKKQFAWMLMWALAFFLMNNVEKTAFVISEKLSETSRTEQGHTRVPSISFHFDLSTILS